MLIYTSQIYILLEEEIGQPKFLLYVGRLLRDSRQFGFMQAIPEHPPLWHEDCHKYQLRGNILAD